jgi:hypothetical protein
VSDMNEEVAQFLEQVAAEVRQHGLAKPPKLQRTAEAATRERAWGRSRYRIDVTIDRKDMDELAEQQRKFAESPMGRAFAGMAGELRRETL